MNKALKGLLCDSKSMISSCDANSSVHGILDNSNLPVQTEECDENLPVDDIFSGDSFHSECLISDEVSGEAVLSLSDIGQSDDEVNDNEVSLHEDLFYFCVISNLSRALTQRLLDILNKHGIQVPKTFHLFNKIQKNKTQAVKENQPNKVGASAGDVAYLSIEENLHFLFENGVLDLNCTSGNTITVDASVNIDGLPLFRSSPLTLWPVLIDFNNTRFPLPVALHCGNGKPDFNEYLKKFVMEVEHLRTEGMMHGDTRIFLKRVIYVFDAPARSSIMSIKGHTSTDGCPFCRNTGRYMNERVVFPTISSELRTDEQYAAIVESNQTGVSPLIKSARLFSDMPIDYQHAVCLGVCRRLFHFYFGKVKSFKLPCKISLDNLKKLDCLIENISKYTPAEFQRHPRKIGSNLQYFKATEFRFFLLYIGPYVFKKFLPTPYYNHFLLLHYAIFVFCSTNHTYLYKRANNCIQFFVQQMPSLFGPHSVSYNFHILLHIFEFVNLYGSLDNFSAFRFENFLGIVKRRLKATRYMFQHTINQLHCIQFMCLSNYSKSESGKCFFSNSPPNNCAIINNRPCLIDRVDGDIIYGHKMQFVENLYCVPFDSASLGIGIFSTGRQIVKGKADNKAVAIPINGNSYVIVPYVK